MKTGYCSRDHERLAQFSFWVIISVEIVEAIGCVNSKAKIKLHVEVAVESQ